MTWVRASYPQAPCPLHHPLCGARAWGALSPDSRGWPAPCGAAPTPPCLYSRGAPLWASDPWDAARGGLVPAVAPVTCLAGQGSAKVEAISLPSCVEGSFLPIYSMIDTQAFSGSNWKWSDFCLPLFKGRETSLCHSLRPCWCREISEGLACALCRVPLWPPLASWLPNRTLC